MAEVKNKKIQKFFPKYYGEFDIKFSNEEEKLISKYLEKNFLIRNNLDCDGFKKQGYDYFENSYQIVYNDADLICQNNFSSLRRTIDTCVNVYLKEFLGQQVPNLNTKDEMQLVISNSWIAKVTGNPLENGKLYKSKQKYSVISGILCLNESKNGFYLEDDSSVISDMWDWPTDSSFLNEETNKKHKYFECKKGKLILFSPSLSHYTHISDDITDTRHCLHFNTWPINTISTKTSDKLTLKSVAIQQRELQ